MTMAEAAAEVREPAAGGAQPALPVVAIVGRPNVGKSTLFNRLVGRRQAIVRGEPGTTRDRNYGEAEWRGRRFTVIDTGGLRGEQLTGPYAEPVAAQVGQALAEADAIIFVVDAQAGPLAADWDVAELLRDAPQAVAVCANKADNERIAADAAEFHALGLGEPQVISAHHGRRIDDLLDYVTSGLHGAVGPRAGGADCRLAIIGRPNVGKSSLVNALLRDERMIVSEVPGTTRDAVDARLTFEERTVSLVDTAGIRRRERQLAGRARFVPWAPIIWISALTGEAVDGVVAAALHVAEQRRVRISTGRLNARLRQWTTERPPPTHKGRPMRFYYATQSGVEPPTFVFFMNAPEALHFSYQRYLQRRLREAFGFEGASMRLHFRGRDGGE